MFLLIKLDLLIRAGNYNSIVRNGGSLQRIA